MAKEPLQEKKEIHMSIPIGEAKTPGNFSKGEGKKVGVVGSHKITLQQVPEEDQKCDQVAARALSYQNLSAPSEEKLSRILTGRSLSPRSRSPARELKERESSVERKESRVSEAKKLAPSERRSLSPSRRSVSPSRQASLSNTSLFLEKIASTVRNWRQASPASLLPQIRRGLEALEVEGHQALLPISQTLADEIALLLESAKSRNLSSDEVEGVKEVFNHLVKKSSSISFVDGTKVDKDPNRTNLIRSMFQFLTEIPYEKSVSLIDGQIIHLLKERNWCEVIEEELPNTITLMKVPAIKSWLALSSVKSYSFDTFSSYLGMSLLFSIYANDSSENRREFVEKLMQMHFTRGAPLELNLRSHDRIRSELQNLEDALELRLGNCKKLLVEQVTLENDLYSIGKLTLTEEEKLALFRIEDIDGFYFQFLNAPVDNIRGAFSSYFRLSLF